MKRIQILLYIFCSLLLSAQTTQLELDGAIQIGMTDESTPEPGTIRWNGVDFEGWNGYEWLSLTGVAPPLVDIDENIYRTIQIGNQTWMSEYLRTSMLNDGTPIPLVLPAIEWSNTEDPAYSYYNGDPNLNEIYGSLYNFHAVATDKLCPIGWRVPTINDWITLRDYVGPDNTGGKLKQRGTAHWDLPNEGAIDEFGFEALGSGRRTNDGSYLSLKTLNVLWASDDILGTDGAAYYLHRQLDSFTSSLESKNTGASVRCVKE